MNLWEALRIALRVLRVHRLRSTLTMLGVIIGVAAVILLVAIGTGVQSSFNARFEPLATQITVTKLTNKVPGGGEPKELRDADVKALVKAPHIADVLPINSGEAIIKAPGVTTRATITGSTPEWLAVNDVTVAAGLFYDAAQVHSSARVAVLGSTVATSLFGANPRAALHRTIQINHQPFTVIGTLEPDGEPVDSMAVMPLSAARNYIYGGGDTLSQLTIQAAGAEAVPAATNEITDILYQRHRIHDQNKRDFKVQSLQGALASFNQTLRILRLFTAAVAAISLFVGSIGVLNIMLVSVTERTREIGIRKAIGATRRAILEQFLIESIILSGIGGVIGVLVGIALSALSTTIAPSYGPLFAHYTPAVSIPIVVISFGVSLVIGLLAGGYPAYRAARLRPIQALRYQ